MLRRQNPLGIHHRLCRGVVPWTACQLGWSHMYTAMIATANHFKQRDSRQHSCVASAGDQQTVVQLQYTVEED